MNKRLRFFLPTQFAMISLAVLLVGLGLAHAGTTLTASGQPSFDDPTDKIEPQVLDELSANGRTDYFIWMAEKADLSEAYQLNTKEEKGQYVYDTLVETAERSQAAIRLFLDAQGVDYRPFYIANKILIRDGDYPLLVAIAERPDVGGITANHTIQLEVPMVEPQLLEKVTAIEPNLTFIKADDVWALGYTGQGMVLANHDSGLEWDHPALINQYRGWDGVSVDHNYSWWDATGASPNQPDDLAGHGTYVSGILVGDDGGTNQIGIAPGARTIHCRIWVSNLVVTDSTASECLEWDLAPWDLDGQYPRPDLAPDSINLVWISDLDYSDEIHALRAAGIFVGKYIGNEGPACGTLLPPADHEDVFATGSVDHAGGVLPGTLSLFSSRGPSSITSDYKPNVMAPGQSIRSSAIGGGYEYRTGSSASSPHSVGLVSLLWSANPALRGQVHDTEQIILETAVPLTGQSGSNCGGDYLLGPNNDWGHGTIDALAAVSAARNYGPWGSLSGTVAEAGSQRSPGDPIEGALIRATLSPTRTWRTFSDPSGNYVSGVLTGTYRVAAFAYGYETAIVTDVVILSGTTTVQDFGLAVADQYVISGTVRDALTGWPLYARIKVKGDPFDPPPPYDQVWTDPATGYYSLTLAGSMTYTFETDALNAGYQVKSSPVGVLTGNASQVIHVDIDIGMCSAPGYDPSYLFVEDFETTDGGFVPWPGSEWEWGVPTYPPGITPHSGLMLWGTDLDADADDTVNFHILTGTLSVPADGGFVTWWDWFGNEDDERQVFIGTTRVWDDDGGSDQRYWSRHAVDLTPWAGQVIQLGFALVVDGTPSGPDGWYVDDVGLVPNVGGCNPSAGGLVIGNVYDGNNGQALNDALVINDSGYSVETIRTPEDPAVDDGFYVLFSQPGAHIFTATMKGIYAPAIDLVTVVQSDTREHDFSLAAGRITAMPEGLEINLIQGLSGTLPLTLTNTGNYSVSFEMKEYDHGMIPTGGNSVMSPDSPDWIEAAPIPYQTSFYGFAQCLDDRDRFYVIGGAATGPIPLRFTWRYDAGTNAWEDLSDLPVPLFGLAATCYEGKIYAAGGSAGSGSTNLFYIYDISNDTWTAGPPLPRIVSGAALGAWDGMLYLVGGHAALFNTINRVDVYDLALGTWEVSGGSPMPVQVNYSGWVQVGSHLYLAGGKLSNAAETDLIQRYDMSTDTWEPGPRLPGDLWGSALAVSEAYLYSLGGVYGEANDYVTQTLRVDQTAWPGGEWLDINDPLPQGVVGNSAGFCTEAATGGEVWSAGGTDVELLMTDRVLYRPSEPCSRMATDVPWLQVEPFSGTIVPGGNIVVAVTIDAGSPGVQMGEYYAKLLVSGLTPYSDPLLPVTLTVYGYGVEILPENLSSSDLPGTSVIYTLTVTNTGNITDNFDLIYSGNEWTVHLPVTQTTLAPFSGADVVAQVDIPLDALVDAMDAVTITAVSQGDPSKQDSSVLSTTASVLAGVELNPGSLANNTPPGRFLTYTLQLTNTGNWTDTFTLGYTTSQWTVHLPVTQTNLAAGESVPVIANVLIPEDAADGDMDTAAITAVSHLDTQVSASSELTSTAVWWRNYLPVVSDS